ncbi:MAG: WecB/TagA/CpsF family glycosyltransferase [Bacteroidota bacterium]
MSEDRRIDFLGIPLDTLTMQETIERIDETIREGGKLNHVVINAGKVVAMQKNKELFQSVVTCDLINADGQSIVWAVRMLGKKIPERVAGIDLMEKLVELAAEKGYGCFFFGAREEVVGKVVEIYTKKYGPSVVAGYRNGYFGKNEEGAIAQMIGDSGARLLFVAMPSPKKENFMFSYREVMKNVNFNMGVGGSFDVIAGYTKRAPGWMQKMGMEWFYRFLQEPGRMWKRYLVGNSRFILLVLKARFRRKKPSTL